MDVFSLRSDVINDYGAYVRSFLTIKDERIRRLVGEEMEGRFLWPDPLIQLNPSFEAGETLQQLIDNEELHPECINIFRDKREDGGVGAPFRLLRHQIEGIRAARAGDSYVLTTGTGSGKSLSYIVPIVDHVLRRGSRKGIQAIVVYPMHALANSQMGEVETFLSRGYPAGQSPVTFRRYTGQESDDERKDISVDVRPERVIGENFRRATSGQDLPGAAFVERLRTRLQSGKAVSGGDTDAFLSDPLSLWIESTLGLREEEGSGRLLRCTPRSFSGDEGVAAALARVTGLERDLCEAQLREALLSAYLCRDANDHALFAFRLHQFVSKGDSVYASPEPEPVRHVALRAQQFVPRSGRAKVLLPVAFCRECGQESDTEERKIHIRVEGELHRLLRIRCAELDATIQEYVVGLLERNLRPRGGGREGAPRHREKGKSKGRKGGS